MTWTGWRVLATSSNAFFTLVSSVDWHAMTWRALSVSPYFSDPFSTFVRVTHLINLDLGWGVIENKQSIDVESPPPPSPPHPHPPSPPPLPPPPPPPQLVCMRIHTHGVSRPPMSFECLVPTTLLLGIIPSTACVITFDFFDVMLMWQVGAS